MILHFIRIRLKRFAILLRVKKMVTIVFPGRENKACAKALCAILERFGGAVFADETEISDYAPVASQYFVCNANRLCRVPMRESVLLLTDTKHIPKMLSEMNFGRVVADSDSTPCTTENAVIVGMRKDSQITVSSVDSDRLQICVQKALKTFSGKEILPCEFSVACTANTDLKTALFAFAVLLLSDKADTVTLKMKL